MYGIYNCQIHVHTQCHVFMKYFITVSPQKDCNFHDPLLFDCDDHTESFPLPGGIWAIYNHTHKRWHVLLPPTTTAPTPSGDEGESMIDSAEYRPPSEVGSEGR